MYENTRGRQAFLVNLMFCRPDKLDGPICGGGRGEKGGVYTVGAYQRNFTVCLQDNFLLIK